MSQVISLKRVKKIYRTINRQIQGNAIRKTYRYFFPQYMYIEGVSDIDLSINEGEFIGLIGENGAGKTTTIKLMTGILTPEAGQINILGYIPYKERKDYTKHIGLVMGQKSLLWYNIPVIETLKLYKEIYKVTESDFKKRIDFFHDIFDAHTILFKAVRHLSLGQRMRAELMASLLHKPKVLFLDEPTIGLDILSKGALHNHLVRINKEENITIILTSHNIHEIQRLCQRIVLLHEGKKIKDIPIENLLNQKKERCYAIQCTRSEHISSLEEFIKELSLEILDIDENSIKIHIDVEHHKKSVAQIFELPYVSSIYEDRETLESYLLTFYREMGKQ